MEKKMDADIAEHVGEALYHHECGGGAWHGETETLRQHYRERAVAAVSAFVQLLHEPTCLMHDEGVEVYNKYGFAPERIFLAMLDAAVEPPAL
jgi:hypothetical protein